MNAAGVDMSGAFVQVKTDNAVAAKATFACTLHATLGVFAFGGVRAGIVDNAFVDVNAVEAVAGKSGGTVTREPTASVGASGGFVAIVQAKRTFVYVGTVNTVAGKTDIAGTRKRTYYKIIEINSTKILNLLQ